MGFDVVFCLFVFDGVWGSVSGFLETGKDFWIGFGSDRGLGGIVQ